MNRITEKITKTAVMLFALCLTSGAWAAAGDTVTFNNDKTPKWTGTATPDLAAADTYTITIPTGTLSSGDYVRMSSFAFAQNSTSQALQVMYVSCVDYNGETVTSGIANGNGLHAGASGGTATKFANIAGWKQVYTFGDVGADNELILKVGTSYTFALLGSDKNKTAQEKVVTFPTTEASTSPVVHSATASNQRIEQEVVVKVLAATTQSTSTGGNWSELTWSNAPADWSSASAAPVLVIVEESCSIALDTSVSVDSMIFDITPGKTLTLTGANTITAANGMFIKGGTIAVANEGTLSGAIKVQGDAGITISGNSDTAGSVSIDVADGATLNLSASSLTSADTINLTGSGAVVPQTTIAAKVDIGAGVTVSANSGATIRVSNFKGAGTIVFDGVLPSNAAAANSTVTASATDSSNWTGTLWLKNYNTDQGSKGLYMPYWGNVDSKVKFTNVAGYLPCKQGNTQYLGYDDSELGEWILEDEVVDAVTKYAFTKTDGFSGYWVRFKKLSGSGTMAEKSGATQTPQVRIADGSEFTGTLKLDQGMRVAFSDEDVTISGKQIVIASGEEVTASTSWTTDGFVVNGTLNLNAAPSGKVVGGSGTVNLGSLSVANGISEFASAAAWTGKVVVPSIDTTGSNLSIGFNSLGNSGSTVILKGVGFTGNYPAVYPAEAGTGSTVNPTLQIDGDVTFTWGHSSEYVTSFSRITGTGNLNFDPCNGDCTYKYKINTLEGYTGLLGVYNDGTYKMQLEIGTLALDSMPTTSDRIVKINTANNWGNIVNVADIAVTVGGEATEYKLIKKNVGSATAGLYLAPAVIKASDGTLTPYESVDAAFTALSSLANDAYDYVAVYDSATVTYSNSYKTPKIKTIGDGVVLTLNSGYGDYGWAAGSPGEDGVVTYSFGPIPATYTWVGAKDALWFAVTSWQCGGDAANRFIGTTDNAIFSSDASVTISGNYTVASITNSANVAFTATSAQTITVGDGGVVMTALGNSITLTNVTLSKVPTTTAATLAVQTTGGGEDPTVYTVVNSVASVDGVGYATIAEASEALKTSTDTRIILQQDYDGAVTIYPGKYLVQNGYTVTSVVGADTDGNADDGIVVTRYGNSVANYYWSCVDQRTATWSGAGSAYWTVMGNWVEQFTPTAYTAVTIPATEGHATAITLSGDVTIKSLALGAGETLTLSRSGETARTFTTSEAIVLTSGQSIVTNPGVTISPAITTEDANSYVKSVTSDGATTYTVAVHKATVYDAEDAEVKKYDSLADAFAAATDGQKITLFADSNVAIALNGKSITFNESSYTFTGSFSGSGTLTLSALLKSADAARWAEGWTGTVVLPENADVSGCNFDNYGIEGSVVRLTGATTATWLRFSNNNSNPVAPAIEIPEGASFTLASEGFSSSFAYTFNVLKGAGSFTINISGNIDRSESGYSAYFLLKDVSNFTGSLSASGAGIAIGDTRISNSVAGGKIIVSAGKSATIASGATWQTASGFSVNGALTCSKGGKIYGTGDAGTLALGGSGVITNRYEGGSSQCFNAGTITVSDSLSVVMVGGWSNFGTTWNPQDSSSIGFDPGSDNDIWLNSTIPNNSNANCTLCIYGNGSNKVVWNSNSITPWAKIHVYNGGKLQIGTATGSSDYLGYATIGALGAVTVDAGGELYFYTRETYTRHTYLNGGTITFAGDQSSRSFDIFRGPTVYVTDDSVMQATGSGHWVYLRDTAPTFNVDANKTLTFNASFTCAGESDKDLSKTGLGTMVVNGYVDGSGNHESFSQPKGVDIREGTYELNTVQSKSTAGGDAYTVASGAKLKVGATGQANMTTLNLVDGSLLEFGSGAATLINANTVTFASGTTSVAFSPNVTPTDGTTLLAWSSAPDGLFAFADSSLNTNWVLFKEATGLKVYTAHINDNAETPAEVGTVSMESDGSLKATVAPTGAAVTLPERITKLEVSVTGNAFGTLTAPGVTTGNVVVKYDSTVTTGAYTIAKDGDDVISFTLKEDGSVDGVSVNPAVDTTVTPMTMSAGNAPIFKIKTIPGLWYNVYSSTDGTTFAKGSAGAIQATDTSSTLDDATAMGDGETVRYYRIHVGATEAEAEE